MAHTSQVQNEAEKLSKHASRLAGDVREAGAAAKRAATHSAEALRESASEYLEQGREKAREVGETVQTRVREQPVTSMLIAAGVGFLLGLMFVRR